MIATNPQPCSAAVLAVLRRRAWTAGELVRVIFKRRSPKTVRMALWALAQAEEVARAGRRPDWITKRRAQTWKACDFQKRGEQVPARDEQGPARDERRQS